MALLTLILLGTALIILGFAIGWIFGLRKRNKNLWPIGSLHVIQDPGEEKPMIFLELYKGSGERLIKSKETGYLVTLDVVREEAE